MSFPNIVEVDEQARFIRLLALQSKLAASDWSALHLQTLDPLRLEVDLEIERYKKLGTFKRPTP